MTLQQLLWELAAGESIEFTNSNHDAGRITMRTFRPKNGERVDVTTDVSISLASSDAVLEDRVARLIEEHRRHTR